MLLRRNITPPYRTQLAKTAENSNLRKLPMWRKITSPYSPQIAKAAETTLCLKKRANFGKL